MRKGQGRVFTKREFLLKENDGRFPKNYILELRLIILSSKMKLISYILHWCKVFFLIISIIFMFFRHATQFNTQL